MSSTSNQVRVVRGPDYLPICVNDLPADNTVRWVKRRRETVAAAVRGGLISQEEALTRYRLSSDELDAWLASIADNPLIGMPLGNI